LRKDEPRTLALTIDAPTAPVQDLQREVFVEQLPNGIRTPENGE
jgi:hypothetical protein